MMKAVILAFVVFFIGSNENVSARLLGEKECTWGPSYWCQNLTAAASCHATKHCIQTDWIHRQLPPDTSNVCQTCLKMVKEARDNLLSNETQELIKEVFEGTCNLTHFKVIVRECDKIVDGFIPDLIDTLASEMNPQVVCSVAGLCNNALYLKSLEIENGGSPSGALKPASAPKDECAGCRTVVGILEDKFDGMSKDEVLQGFLMMCRNTGSLSDACSNIVLTYFAEIYSHIKENFRPSEVCILSGQCSALFHTHDAPHGKDVQITPISNIGFVNVNNGQEEADLPCDLCEQLVNHLRDLLVVNTTEEEFKKVMEGLCRQTKSFADECLGLVDEYYPIVYRFLMDELNSTAVCSMVGLCPRNFKLDNIPMAPLLPQYTADELEIRPLSQKPVISGRIPLTKGKASIQIVSKGPLGALEAPEMSQLPIERLGHPIDRLMYNKELCEFCQYFLHYVQQLLTSTSTEEEIKKAIDKACDDLPTSINQTCYSFVETYEPALVALLAQEIDPSQICPMIRVCPKANQEEVIDVDVFMTQHVGDNSQCPLCLFAVQELEKMVKDKKTEENIKNELDKLCSKLAKDLAPDCEKFVSTYTDELIEMLIKDFDPKMVCVYLKLCTDSKPAPPVLEPVQKDQYAVGIPETNDILDDTYNGIVIEDARVNVNGNNVKSIECTLCKVIMNEIEKLIGPDRNQEVIVKALDTVCNLMPSAIRDDCTQFIDENGKTILKLLVIVAEPGDVCPMLQLCAAAPNMDAMKKTNDILNDTYSGIVVEDARVNVNGKNVKSIECVICKVIMNEIEKLIGPEPNQESIVKALDTVCNIIPWVIQDDCTQFIDKNGKIILEFLAKVANPGDFCSIAQLCATAPNLDAMKVEIFDCSICKTAVWAMEKILANPKVDHEMKHVLEKTCRALPGKDQNKCREIIEKYGTEIFDLIERMADKSLICKEIGICAVGTQIEFVAAEV